MADQDLLPGNRFRLYRKGAGDADWKFVCLATTITFDRTANSEKIVVADCDNPTNLTHERVIKTSLAWSIAFSGKSDPKRIQFLEGDYENENSVAYQLVADRPALQGGQTSTGNMQITKLTLTRSENGAVSFSATGDGDGVLTRAAAAV